MGHISGGEIDQARHILGWCTEARFLAGMYGPNVRKIYVDLVLLLQGRRLQNTM
jgi:hypothetical protein